MSDVKPWMTWWMLAAGIGVFLAAVYNLSAVRRVNQGPVSEEWFDLRDASPVDLLAAAPLVVGIIVLGLVPGLVLSLTNPVITALSTLAGGGS